jgi:hypothetical protein
MDFVKAYFLLGLAMLFVVLWDFKYLPNTASRLVKQHGDVIVRIFSLASRCGIGAVRKELKVNKD